MIPLSNERLHCGDLLAEKLKLAVEVIPLSNERLHCGFLGWVRVGAVAGVIPLSNERLHCGDARDRAEAEEFA